MSELLPNIEQTVDHIVDEADRLAFDSMEKIVLAVRAQNLSPELREHWEKALENANKMRDRALRMLGRTE